MRPDDKVTIQGLDSFAPAKVRFRNVNRSRVKFYFVPLSPQPLTAVFTHTDGSTDSVKLNHTFNDQQIGWFKAGSALNRMKEMSN